MKLFDTHLHLDDEQFDGQREQVVARALEAGVSSMLAVGTTADSSDATVQLAENFDAVYAAVGIQPNYCAQAQPGDWDRITALAGNTKVIAIGETGLDGYRDYSPLDLQQEYFERHLDLARQTGLPFIVHMRDCAAEMLAMLTRASEHGPLKGVMHSFTGDGRLAEACLQLGLYVSFAGMVTYKKSDDLRAVAATIPDDRILIETDAPYLSPEPVRGRRPNEPALVRHTAECLAEVRGISVETLSRQTTANAHRIFRPGD